MSPGEELRAARVAMGLFFCFVCGMDREFERGETFHSFR